MVNVEIDTEMHLLIEHILTLEEGPMPDAEVLAIRKSIQRLIQRLKDQGRSDKRGRPRKVRQNAP